MKVKLLIAGAFAVGFVLPAAAQTSTSYYVVQNVHTRKCTILHKSPTTTEYTVVAPNGVTYQTQTEAESAMSTVKVCHSN